MVCAWSAVTMTRVSSGSTSFITSSMALSKARVSDRARTAFPLWWAASMRPPWASLSPTESPLEN